MDMNVKNCFVIAPIGEPDTSTRRRSDQVLRHIIRPAVQSEYVVVRADEIAEPGLITSQIMQRVIEDDLVIADLTDLNPNVLYELAVRHAVLKPFVQIIASGQTIPFDVSGIRTIFFDLQDPDSVADAKDEITAQVRALEDDSSNLQTPISIPLELQRIRQSEEADVPGLREILPVISDIASTTTASRDDIQKIREVLIGGREPERARIGGIPLRGYIQLAMDSPGGRGFVVLINYFQGREPGLYELGMEAYRQAQAGNVEAASDVFESLLFLGAELPRSRGSARSFESIAGPLMSLFDRLIDRVRSHQLDRGDKVY